MKPLVYLKVLDGEYILRNKKGGGIIESSKNEICFRCGKKILSEEDMIFYDRRLYHKKCALTLLEKIKKKVIKKMLGGKK